MEFDVACVKFFIPKQENRPYFPKMHIPDPRWNTLEMQLELWGRFWTPPARVSYLLGLGITWIRLRARMSSERN